MHTFTYKTHGVCSRSIDITLDDDNIIKEVVYHGGCAGNTQGVSALIVGMSAEEAARRLTGIHCGPKSTSCPDQLANALREYLDGKVQG